MAVSLDIDYIRSSSPSDVASLFRKTLSLSPVEESTRQLLQAIERGSITTKSLSIFLSLSHSPISIKLALEQTFSVQARRLGIKHLRKALNGAQWRQHWDGLGGTAGMIALMSEFSVKEVRAVCRAIGGCGKGHDVGAKRQKISGLLEALCTRIFPDAAHRTTDKRPLTKHYQRLLPGCTPQVVMNAVDKIPSGEWEYVQVNRLLEHQADTLKDIVCRDLLHGTQTPDWLGSIFGRYPSVPGSHRGFSASMEFSLEVLRKLVSQEWPAISGHDFLKVLVEPLLRRAVRKKVEWPRKQEIIDLTLAYFEKHPDAVNDLGREHGRLVHQVALCWSRKPELFSKQLGTLLLRTKKPYRSEGVDDFKTLLQGVAKSRRYALLRFCYKEVTNLDLELDTDLRETEGVISYSLFGKLETEQALRLFTRLRKARGDHELVGSGPSGTVASKSARYGESDSDPALIHIVLLQRHGQGKEATQLAEEKVQDCRKKAMRSSDPTQRAWYAQSVLYYALASGSYQLLKEVMLWSQRFVRDPLTATYLWSSYIKEARELLCAIPENVTGKLDLTTLRTHIQEANSVLRIAFQTACLALSEPDFNSNLWQDTIKIFYETISVRLDRSANLIKAQKLQDTDAYNLIWDDTIKLLMEIDEAGLKSGHDRLRVNQLGGILSVWRYGDIYERKDEPSSTYRFFDDLAQARDQLWRNYRPTVYPAATSLPKPYPRGLPIQHLVGPFMACTAELEKVAPYLASRVQAAVFVDAKAALTPVPDDEEAKRAIGNFIDDYFFALRMYLPESLDQEERKRRVDTAWAHAAGTLSEARMSYDEAMQYWKYPNYTEYMDIWPPNIPLKKENIDWPVLPRVEDTSEVEEWNPGPQPKKKVEVRRLPESTYVDLSICIGAVGLHEPEIDTDFDSSPDIPMQYIDTNEIFSSERTHLAKKVSAVQEGQLLSALLFLDTSNNSRKRILSTPFLSKEDVRYPAVYLDDYFLSKVAPNSYFALKTLEAHIENVTPTLLAQLAQNTVESLNSSDPSKPENIELESTAFKLIKLLALSDRPVLATKLAVQTVIDRPSASSWHRQLLAPAIFRRLSASDARACFLAFADAIIGKLEEQKKAREATNATTEDAGNGDGSTGGDQASSKQPFVKITTVKLLAQLLRDTEFVSEEFSVSVLATLSQKASHMDIKKAVLDSLLNMLMTAQPNLASEIFTSLEGILSMTGKLDERQPLSETDWEAAWSASGKPTVPEVDFNSRENVPMLTTLFDNYRLMRDGFPHKQAYTDRIIHPLIASLKQETKKWLELFLASMSAPAGILDELPLVPRNGGQWRFLLQANPDQMPVSLLQEYVEYMIFCVKPTPAVASLNKELSSDPALRSQLPVQTWLQLYGPGLSVLSQSLHLGIPSLLGIPTTLSEGGMTNKAIQELFLNLFTATLWSDDPNYTYVEMLTKQLWPYRFDEKWLEYKKPIVEAIILYIDTLRTRDWERDPKRQPSVLPDTFPLRLWLLKYPSTSGLEGDQEGKCKAYAEQISKLLDQITGSLYHKKLEQLKHSFHFVHGMDRVIVALQLGDIKKTRLSWLMMQDLLRVEVAAELVKDAKVSNEDLKGRVNEMLESWKASESEEVRRIGCTMQIE